MLKAIEHATTTRPPSRRGLLTGGTAALLAGTAIATSAPGTAVAAPSAIGPDDELLRLHGALLAQAAVVARIEAEADSMSGAITPESRAQEQRLTEADDAWYGILEDIIDTPAQTAVGLRVKAAVTLIAQQKYVCVHTDHTIDDIVAGDDGNIEDRLALSIARDLLGGSVAA